MKNLFEISKSIIIIASFFFLSCNKKEEFIKNDDNDIAIQLKAFPSAEGAGANTTGGRGGIVVHVTNLNDSGSGSFREALVGDGSSTYKTTPRTIVFDVSGTIEMNDWIDEGQIKNLTIAGQTAPKGGITLNIPGFIISNCENVIIRYIRFVNTAYFNPALGFVNNTTALGVSGGNNVIVDHCSMRYTWKTLGFSALENNDTEDGQGEITLQRSILGDCFTGILIGGAATYPRSQLGGTNSVHHNLFAHISHRFPNVVGDSQVEVIENVAYNYRARLSTFFNNSEANLINNTYKAGPSSNFTNARNKIADYINSNPVDDTPRVYMSGNRIDETANNSSNNYSPTDTDMQGLFVNWLDNSGGAETEITSEMEKRFRAFSPFADLGIPIVRLGTDAAYSSVLEDVGTNAYLNADGSVGRYTDVMDTHYINDTRNGTLWNGGTKYVDKTDQNALIYPVLPTNTRPESYDTDNDGMPDLWEIAKFGDLSRNGTEDLNADGYTDLEEFINLVDN